MVCLFQYHARSRTSAAEGMKHAFFNSMGPSVHRLPDSKYFFAGRKCWGLQNRCVAGHEYDTKPTLCKSLTNS